MMNKMLLMCTLLIGSHYAHAQENTDQLQEQTAPSYENEEKQGTYPVKYVRSVKIRAVLVRLHTIDRTKAFQYASALALQLRQSNHPVDRELYQILCRYIALTYQEMTANQGNTDAHDAEENSVDEDNTDDYDDYDEQDDEDEATSIEAD